MDVSGPTFPPLARGSTRLLFEQSPHHDIDHIAIGVTGVSGAQVAKVSRAEQNQTTVAEGN